VPQEGSGGWAPAAESRSHEPDAHDARLAGACETLPGLDPVAVLVPPTGAPTAAERACRVAATARPRVVRLCPGGHRYPLAGWVLSPLPELCDRHGVALMLDFDARDVPWEQVVAFARSYPSVPMVVLDVAVGDDHALAAALDAAPNLVAHVGALRAVADLAYLVEVFGAPRFVWGSDSTGAGTTRTAVAQEGDLFHDARQAILHGNARALGEGRYAELLA